MQKIKKLCANRDRFGASEVRRFTYPEKPFSLPVELLAVGEHYISSHEYSWDGSLRGGVEDERALIQYSISGHGAVEWNGKRYEVPPGHAMLLTFPENHRYFLPPESGHWKVLYISFCGSAATEMIRKIRDKFGVIVPLSATGKTLSLARGLLASDLPSTFWDSASEGFRLLTTLGNELERHTPGSKPAFLERILDYCRNHLEDDLSVDVLAEIAGYSRWHFSRKFMKAQGISVPRFITELRIQQAAELLRQSSCSIKEAAMRCGFRNSAYFIRCFVRTFGVTPGMFHKGN